VTTASWPITNQPITHALWSDEFGGQDGIIGDYSGNGFRLVLPGTGDNATIKSGSARYRLRGFVLKVTADHTVNLPGVAVGGADKVYDIGIKYDATLEADSGGPLTVYSEIAGSYSDSSSVSYHKMYQVTRTASQALSAAAVVEYRTWVSGHYYGFNASLDQYPLPLGSRLTVGTIDQSNDYFRHRVVAGDGSSSLTWASTNLPTWTALTLASGLSKMNTTPAYCSIGPETILRGTVQKTSGSQLVEANGTKILATLPSAYRPLYAHRFPVAVSFAGTNDAGRIYIDSDGRLQFTPSGDDCSWVSLDGIRFFSDEY
jgi:hypothetical protein